MSATARSFEIHAMKWLFTPSNTSDAPPPSDDALRDALAHAHDQTGASLLELSRAGDVLVIFLRHFGCTFCREAVADVAAHKAELDANTTDVVFVHMSPADKGDAFFADYGLPGARHISDPDKRLYRAFGLGRGNLRQLFGPKSWTRGFKAGILDGHLVGKLAGDGFQMPGMFLLRDDAVVRAMRHDDASTRPDYVAFACDSDACAMPT